MLQVRCDIRKTYVEGRVFIGLESEVLLEV